MDSPKLALSPESATQPQTVSVDAVSFSEENVKSLEQIALFSIRHPVRLLANDDGPAKLFV
jgi:hypothetical protein